MPSQHYVYLQVLKLLRIAFNRRLTFKGFICLHIRIKISLLQHHQSKIFCDLNYLPSHHCIFLQVLKLLRIAFDRRLTFTVGVSSSNGMPDCVVWNDIHHKTATSHGAAHGYPDPTYLGNVTKELANVGVTENCKEFRDMGDPFPQQKRGYWNWY